MRPTLADAEELTIARRYFPVYTQRTDCPRNSQVIGRYSVLPYYMELEQDLYRLNSCLVNSYTMHRWIADFDYYSVLQQYTPKTWFDWEFHKCRLKGPFIVKGRTNSRKYNWNTDMFAKDKRTALEIGTRLASNEFIGPQGIIYRQYIPLKIFEIGLHGLPFANEWRFFYYRNHQLSYGYYWSNADCIQEKISLEGIEFAQTIANIVAPYVTFFVLDIAEKADGGWILIEINDAQMSGLSENNPDVLYKNLEEKLNG